MTARDKARPLVSLRKITKRFSTVLANDSVDLDLYPGEVHALLGENGAGKSTLMKILYGFYTADSGSIILDGEKIRLNSPLDARKHRIGMVFQTFTLVPAMTAAENIALYLPDLSPVLDNEKILSHLDSLAQRYQLQFNLNLAVRDLPLGDQQKVEVLKLLTAKARVLIFDEATRVLAPHEIEGLFNIFESLKKDGYAIVFITHKMREVLQCADKVSVLRRGRLVETIDCSQATESTLVKMMFGDVEPPKLEIRDKRAEKEKDVLLELKGAGTAPTAVRTQLSQIDLKLKKGEIVGIVGVSGNGQRELVDAILGFLPLTEGSKFIRSRDATSWTPKKIRSGGIGFIPEEPLQMGVVPWMNLVENTALGDLETYALYGGFGLDWPGVAAKVEESFQTLNFEPLDPHRPVRSLSGGQLQRVVLARELGRDPQVLIASYPTRGLDVHSAAATFGVFAQLRDRGGAVLLISEDLDDLFKFSDRLIVLYQGKIAGTFAPQEIDRHKIGHLMTGSQIEAAEGGG